ncbi:MAG: hypothetical protein ACM3Q4_10495 [Acidobacteriota bacterium]
MKNDDDAERKIVFCTQCGNKLDNFCFDGSASDLEAVKKHMEECKREGRFKGEMCSRVFIADDSTIDAFPPLPNEDEDDGEV